MRYFWKTEINNAIMCCRNGSSKFNEWSARESYSIIKMLVLNCSLLPFFCHYIQWPSSLAFETWLMGIRVILESSPFFFRKLIFGQVCSWKYTYFRYSLAAYSGGGNSDKLFFHFLVFSIQFLKCLKHHFLHTNT